MFTTLYIPSGRQITQSQGLDCLNKNLEWIIGNEDHSGSSHSNYNLKLHPAHSTTVNSL